MRELAKKKTRHKNLVFCGCISLSRAFPEEIWVFCTCRKFCSLFFSFCSKIGEMAEIFFFFLLNQKGQMDYPFFSFCSKSGEMAGVFFSFFLIKKGQQNENDRYYPRGPKITTPAASR